MSREATRACEVSPAISQPLCGRQSPAERKVHLSTIIIAVKGESPDYGERSQTIDFAHFELTDELKQLALKRRSLFLETRGRDDQLWKMLFWDYRLRWLSEPEDGWDPGIDTRTGCAVVDGPPEIPEECVRRTECDQMVVNDMGVWWRCIQKHSDDYVVTDVIPWAVFDN